MHGRVNQIRVDANRLDEVIARMPQIKRQVAALDGQVMTYAFWNEDGTGLTVAVYESAEAAEAAAPKIRDIWGGLADLLVEPPVVRDFTSVENMRR